MASPLGKYSEVVAAIVALSLTLAGIAVHVGVLNVGDTGWIDTAAGLAVGVILGQRATTNGAARVANVANARIDILEAHTGISTHPSPPVP